MNQFGLCTRRNDSFNQNSFTNCFDTQSMAVCDKKILHDISTSRFSDNCLQSLVLCLNMALLLFPG